MQPVWVPELQEYWPVEKPCDWTLETSGHDNWFWGGEYFKCTDFQFSFQVVCFGENCKYSPKDDNMYERLSNLGMHFIEVHSFKQDAYRWNIDTWAKQNLNLDSGNATSATWSLLKNASTTLTWGSTMNPFSVSSASERSLEGFGMLKSPFLILSINLKPSGLRGTRRSVKVMRGRSGQERLLW